MDKCFKGCLF